MADGAQIGRGTVLFPGVFVGKGVAVVEECTIHPNVTIYEGTTIGRGVVIHAGAIIGADGFGYVYDKGVIGLVLAAPVLATFNLVSRYVLRKMFDLEPWPEVEGGAAYPRGRWVRGWHRIQVWFRALSHRIRGWL